MPESFAFRITGIEPHDAAWRNAPESLRREFWRAVVAIGLVAKDAELVQGLDVHGDPMVAIAPYTRAHRRSAMGPADPNAPPLTPAHALSRTRSLLAGRAGKDYAEFYWKFDAVLGMHWGRLLGYHRSGAGRLPKRNVIGISPQSLTSIRHKAQVWWDYRKRGIVLEQAVRDFRLPANTPVMPAKIPVVGRTDFANFTFGINGDLSLVERASQAGTFTGFRQFHPPATGPTPAKAPKKPPAKPRPANARVDPPHRVPPKPRTPAVPSVPVPTFVPSARAKDQGMRTVLVDVAAFDSAFQRDKGYAIARGGAGAIPGRLAGVEAFLKTGRKVEQPEVVVNKDGSVSFINGRHRFAVLRDQGITKIPVSVPKSQATKAKQLFGAAPNPPKLAPAAAAAPAPVLPVRPTAPAAGPTAPILPGRPIAERIAAYTDGHERVKRLAALGSEVAPLRAAVAAQRATVESLAAAYKAAARGAAKKAAKVAMDQAEDELRDRQVAVVRAERTAREAAQFLLDAPRRLQMGLFETTYDNLTQYQLDATLEGLRWLQRTVAHPEGRAPFALNIDKVADDRPQRSDCGKYFMRFSKFIEPATAVHEIGHHLDYHMDGVDAAAREYLAHRVGDEKPVQLREVFKDNKAMGKFNKDEYGRKDRFADAFGDGAWYVGKAYDDGMTEVTSMGLEMMFRDPVGFAQKDPDFAAWILGIMHGPLR